MNFLILACDGLWDVLSSLQAVKHARRKLRYHNDIDRVSTDLVAESLRLSSDDNVTAMVIGFAKLDPATGEKFYVVKPKQTTPPVFDDGETPPAPASSGKRPRFVNSSNGRPLFFNSRAAVSKSSSALPKAPPTPSTTTSSSSSSSSGEDRVFSTRVRSAAIC
eukprot:TRINITY_DN4038_c0_g1_i1.p1 TRINITY_DN4038_c0_g1~~TRINITY_DN4038_c0_g1_i1.p1  ORF type:complete len:163 (+),score=28.00 TRINITY_DN4038_c0_g1_i1:174-662(+)